MCWLKSALNLLIHIKRTESEYTGERDSDAFENFVVVKIISACFVLRCQIQRAETATEILNNHWDVVMKLNQF